MAEHVWLDDVLAGYPGEDGGDQAARGVAPGLEPAAPAERDDLGHQHTEHHPLGAHEHPEQEEQGQHGVDQGLTLQEPAGQGHADDLDAAETAHPEGGGHDLLAVLDGSGTEDRRDDAAHLLQGLGEPHYGVRAGNHVDVDRHEGRRVDQPEARHAQHAVQVVADVVALQVIPDEGLVLGLPGCRFRIGLRWGGAGRSGAVRRGDRQTLRGRFVPAQSEFARPGKTGGGPPCNMKSNLMGFGSTRVPVRDKPALNPGPEIRPRSCSDAGNRVSDRKMISTSEFAILSPSGGYA